MPAFRALYYPSWNPPVAWFRSTLLFFDQISVIRPEDVRDPQYHTANAAVIDLMPQAFSEIKRKSYELSLSPRNKELFTSTLDYIVEKLPRRVTHSTSLAIGEDGVTVPGHALLHVSKLPPVVQDELSRRRLLNEEAERVVRQLGTVADFRVVERNAANVILALIADHYAREANLRTITDQGLGYLSAALNENPVRRKDATAMHLATAILRVQIPKDIEALTPNQFVSLRQRYDDIREPFQRAVRTLCDDHLIGGIESRTQFEGAVRDATADFSTGVDKLLKSAWAKKFATWTPMSLGVLSSLCKLATPVIATIGVGLDACLKIYGALRGSTAETDVRHAQRLMATLRSEFMRPTLLRRIVLK